MYENVITIFTWKKKQLYQLSAVAIPFYMAKHSLLFLIGYEAEKRMVDHDVSTEIANIAPLFWLHVRIE